VNTLDQLSAHLLQHVNRIIARNISILAFNVACLTVLAITNTDSAYNENKVNVIKSIV